MLSVQARFTTTEGKGIGRWRAYAKVEDMELARWYVKGLVPKCQIRVLDGRTVVVTPRRAEEFV